jgi:hypothetical protein
MVSVALVPILTDASTAQSGFVNMYFLLQPLGFGVLVTLDHRSFTNLSGAGVDSLFFCMRFGINSIHLRAKRVH